jgi:hypothetical protein
MMDVRLLVIEQCLNEGSNALTALSSSWAAIAKDRAADRVGRARGW